jgi:prepilin-type N-terminal cleavage/methylation domain-containing protein
MRMRLTRENGLTLLEVLVSLLLLSIVAFANSSVIRSLGLLGVVQSSSEQRPARLRTLAMEYVEAEFEFLQNYPYPYFRDATACDPVSGLPTPFTTPRRVPASYLTLEPQLPAPFYAADIVVTDEPVVGPGTAPDDCRPRRITVNVYQDAAEAPGTPGGSGGVIFMRGESARAP